MLIFVLPAYNEEANLPGLLERISASMRSAGLDYEVVVVDDGSTDGTARLLDSCRAMFPLRVISHATNAGLPKTMADGLRDAVARAAQSDAIIAMDADDTHDPGCAVRMAELLEDGFDIVVASRYAPGGKEVGLSWSRSVLSRGINLILATLLPIAGVRDYTSGYRAYRPEVLRRLFEAYGDRVMECATFTATAELLVKASGLGFTVTEVPLVLRYDRKASRSKMRVVATILEYLRLIARETVRRTAGNGEHPVRG